MPIRSHVGKAAGFGRGGLRSRYSGHGEVARHSQANRFSHLPLSCCNALFGHNVEDGGEIKNQNT
jgi:hypothetical protein